MLRRLRPFLITFFGIELLLRGALFFRESGEITEGASKIAEAFAVGLLYDSAVAAYLLAPLLLYLAYASWYTRRDRLVTTAAYVALLYITLIHCVAEWSFWDDIGTRANYMAWDYLQYPDEVLQMLIHAYHGKWIALAVIIGTPLLWRALHPRMLPRTSVHPTQRTRQFTALAGFALPVVSYFMVGVGPGERFLNQHLNEIAKNGLFQIGSAFFNYELPYESHYLSAPSWKVSEKQVVGVGEEKRYNVVLVVMESMSASYMEAFGRGDELTPNLDRLAKEGLFFTNHYACGTRTVRGIEAISTGLPPIAGPSRVKRGGDVVQETIGSLFASRDYDTRFFYNGHAYFDNMGPFLSQRGFAITDRTAYSKDEVHFENLWGVSDEDLFHKVVREGDSAYQQGTPFFHMVMTMSNHRPFTYPDENVRYASGKSRDGAVHYADYAIGKLIEEAKAYPWFENTLFVFTADHTAYSAGNRELTLSKHHTPFVIYAPALVKSEDSAVLACQIDIAPTIAGLLNWTYTSPFYGRDLLQEGEERAFISNFDRLGLVEDGVLTVLRPNRTAHLYTLQGEPLAEKEPKRVTRAAAIYQRSSKG